MLAFKLWSPSCSDYSPVMSDKLDAILSRLKAFQRDLILVAADIDMLPAGSLLRQIAELENVIDAVEAVVGEEAERDRRGGSRAVSTR